MDDEQRKHFAELMGLMEGVASDARAAASTSRETASVVRKLDGRVSVLEKHVFGSDPPPPSPARPISESVGDHEGDIATLTGQVLALHGKVDKIADKPDSTEVIVAAVKDAAKTPTGQKVVGGIVSVVLIALALLGAKLQAQVTKIEESPAIQIQDGGVK